MCNRNYELRQIGEIVVFDGDEYTIDSYGESVDYFIIKKTGCGFYIDEWQLSNNRCPKDDEDEE